MRILVVEDDGGTAVCIREALQRKGYAVDTVPDGHNGLRRSLATDYDLVILDWLLPGRDGLSVCRELRRAGHPVPILMLTARSGEDDRIAGLDGGADDYLTKPFVLEELLARVRALLRRGVPAGLTELTVADLVLSPSTRLASRGGRTVHLSAREYALLEHLMRHRGQALTRAAISAHVWGYTFDCGTNVVDVYINHLRGKIDRGQSLHLIHTVRGVGYCLDIDDAWGEHGRNGPD